MDISQLFLRMMTLKQINDVTKPLLSNQGESISDFTLKRHKDILKKKSEGETPPSGHDDPA